MIDKHIGGIKMAEVNMKHAKKVYATLIKTMDAQKLNYDKLEEDLSIRSGFNTEDFPVEFLIIVDAQRELVKFLSRLPFNMSDDKKIEGAIATCVANKSIVDGTFDYDVSTGEVLFRLSTSFKGEADITKEIIEYIMLVSVATIDRYNDLYYMLSKGNITLSEFIAKVNA